MKKWFPTFITIALGGLAAATPDIQKAVAEHPNFATGLVTAYAIIQGLIPSPVDKPKP